MEWGQKLGAFLAGAGLFALTACDLKPTTWKTMEPSTDYGLSSYTEETTSSSYDSHSFDQLVPAVSQFFSWLDSRAGEIPEDARIHWGDRLIDLTTYGDDGAPRAGGRFSTWLRPGGTTICSSDFKNNVSFAIVWDFPESDGNTARLYLFDTTNCVTKEGGFDQDVFVEVKPKTVEISEKATLVKTAEHHVVFESLIKSATLLRNVRAHFIGSYIESFQG